MTKVPEASPQMHWLNPDNFEELSKGLAADGLCGERERDFLLPEFVLGYSSGENEILSLPFFKMRFVQFDEYWNRLKEQLPYAGRPETRLAYLDNGFSQAILLCNMLFQDEASLQPFREDVGIEALKEFRIIIHRSIAVPAEVAEAFGRDHPALATNSETGEHRINLMHLLEAGPDSATNFDPMVTRLKRCATCWYVDEATDTLGLDYWVNEATRVAFRENFDHASYKSPLALFQAFQVLLTLNLYAVSDALKEEVYRSHSHYVSETVPTLASDQRIMRFKFVRFTKPGVTQPMMLKELSDGEHQLLHSLGLCLLFRNTNSLFLLDEPETHFNPDWRANFITRLRQCLPDKTNDKVGQEMLITTHAPFLISDSRPDKVLVFKKDKITGVSISQPEYNTLGASINKITMSTFKKRETIGGHAQALLERLRARFEQGGEDKDDLITEIHQQLGDSVEKILLIRTILDSSNIDDGGGTELMLYPYTYVPHQMEKMQEFIDFIFHEVWCKARPNIKFSFNLFQCNYELFEVMKSFYYSDNKNAEFFYGHVERIYGYFAQLKPKHIHRLKWWYQSNNDIEQVCANKPTLRLARYADLDSRYPNLAKELRAFFAGLYGFEAADMYQKVGDINEHYKAFVQINKVGKCPFCGMVDLQGEYHSTREAYDHYLPKALYPFNSINFHNLVPTCHHCNSSYKTSKNLAFTPQDPAGTVRRRRVFYPYAVTPYAIELKVSLQHSDIKNLTPADINLQFGPPAISEEIDTWKNVYGIEERYKAKLCGENDGKSWLIQVLDEWKEDGRLPADFLTTIARQAASRPYADCNFLKKPFLDACKNRGLFENFPI